MTGGQIGNVDLVKQLNSAIVYRLIDQQGPISRIQIADVSQLAPASVTKITRQLLERGLIKEVAQQASTGGRRAISLTTEVAPFHSIAVRVGRDYIYLGLYDLSGKEKILERQFFAYTMQEELVSGLIRFIDDFKHRHAHQIAQLIAISIVLPGLINPEDGVIEYMPNINIEDEKLFLVGILENHFKISCFVGNDVRSLALAEHYFGASKDSYDSIVVSVHHGVGAGIIVNGQVFLGHNRNVGEIGHIQVNPLGERCQCGNFGCLETIASEPAIIQHIRRRLEQGYPSSLPHNELLNIDTICHHANNGDELATMALTQAANDLGKAIAMTVNMFNPQKIVIAGKINLAESIVYPALQRNISHQSLHAFREQLTIVPSSIDDHPALNAFALIKRAMLNGDLLQKLLD
ncbi:ROK family protein [Vibrio zhugei]|uniref:ROK family protein n=1 Tax=Vibrio zhugei TaxID=2479546 RepID=A0ABV7C5G2_9VIBR|nr:ROK family protein [Vibrio zhugei]